MKAQFVFPLTVEANTSKIAKKADLLSSQIRSQSLYSSREAVKELFSLTGRPAQRLQWALADSLTNSSAPFNFGGFTA